MYEGRWLVFDFETTNLEYGSALNPGNRILMTAWKLRGKSVRSHVGDILHCPQFWREVERTDYLVAHNAKFEAHWLLRMGLDPTEKLWYDTMLAERVIAGNRRIPLNLGDTSERYGFQGKDSYIDTLMKLGVCPSEQPQDRLLARCRRDVRTTELVMRKQFEICERDKLLPVVATRCLLTPILTEIEATGMHLDAARVEEEYEQHSAQRATLLRELDELTGGINMRSSPQKATLFYETLGFKELTDRRGNKLRNKPSKQFPDGVPKTDKHTVIRLEKQARTKKQKRFFELQKEFAKVDAALTKNLEFFQGVRKEQGGTFFGEFKQHITQTHRLSSAGKPVTFDLFDKPKSVQFQNMPRKFKRLFTVRNDDYVMVECDGSQLEFRVAAFLGKDVQAIRDIREGADIHNYTAQILNGVKGNEVTKAMRTAAKADTFKPLYGGLSGTHEQQSYYAAFREKYSGIYDTQERWVSEVLGTGILKTSWGLRFYFDFYLDNRGTARHRATHKPIAPSVYNYPIQSLATAEIIPIAVVALHKRVRAAGLRALFVNTVHDSVVCEVHREDLTEFKKCAIMAFTEDVYSYLHQVYGLTFNVPLGCEIVAGTHWGEGEEEKHDIEPIRRVV